MHIAVRVSSVVTVFGIVLALGSDTPTANGHLYRLEQPSGAIPVPAGILNGEWTVAQWQNGLLMMQAARETTQEGVPNLVGADRSGKLVFQHAVWVSGAASLQTIGTAVSIDHLIAVSGSASSPTAGETDFIQELRADGSLLRQIDTDGFLAFSLAYDTKGDLWVAGSAKRVRDSWPDHNILRRYRAGKLQAELLPYAEFLTKYEATTVHKSHPAMHGNEGHAFLLPLLDGVGLWSPGTHEWIEIGSAGSIAGRWQVPLPRTMPTELKEEKSLAQSHRVRLTGLAVTASGEVIASIQTKKSSSEVYRLDKTSLSWQPVTIASDDVGLVGYVAGSDGENVVYRNHAGVGGWAVSSLVGKQQ